MKPLLTSKLVTLMRIPTNMKQWQRSWISGKQSKGISTVSTAKKTKIFFFICSFCQWHAMEGIHVRTFTIDSNHGSENRRTYLTRVGMDKRSNHKHGFEIVLTYDQRRLTPQYPAVQVSVMVPGIGSWDGTLGTVWN